MLSTKTAGPVTLAFWGLPLQALALVVWCSAARVDAQTAAPKPPFTGNDEDGFHFAVEEIEGTIRLDGAYHGVTRLVDKRTGRQVIDPRYSALNLFKLMAVNLVMGQPRNMERTVQATPHWVEAEWTATETHRAEMTARYEVHRPNAVDLTVTVRSRGTYAGYELFLSSYFDKSLRPHVYLRPRSGQAADLVVPTVNDVFRGTVLVFARDAHAARPCLDGRWDRKEGPTPTVQMCPVRHYARCVAFMADPDRQLGVVLMARPCDGYAISTRYHADREDDRLTTYSAFDLSLFGGDLVAGDERTVKVRLAVTPLDGELSQPVKLYEEFLAQAPDPSESKGASP